MPSSVVRKVPGGKMFRVRLAESSEGTFVSLDGDFFLHPEDALGALEGMLADCTALADEQSASRYLRDKLQEAGIEIIGAGAEDLASALWEAKG